MLRNLFAASVDTTNKLNLASYLQTLRLEPSKLASMLAVFIVPISALGWWCYSVVLSVGAMAPLQSAGASSPQVSIPDASINSDTTVNAAGVTSSLSNAASNSESTNANVSNNSSNSSQTTVTIDGQTVPIADQGTTHKVIQNDNGQTTVDVTIDSDTSGRTTSRSSTDINVRSSSRSDVDIRSKEIR